MTQRFEHGIDHEPVVPKALRFSIRQPDGTAVDVDMSAPGGFGDFAFVAVSSDEVKRFLAYWTSESSIFIDIMKRLKRRPMEALAEDIANIHASLDSLLQYGYTPTTEGEGKMDEWVVQYQLAQPDGEPKRYHMFGGGEDVMVVDDTHEDGLHLATDRDMDGEQEYKEIVIPDSELWRFAAGMAARSYSEDGRNYPQLTRFSTAQYDQAFRACLYELA